MFRGLRCARIAQERGSEESRQNVARESGNLPMKKQVAKSSASSTDKPAGVDLQRS